MKYKNPSIVQQEYWRQQGMNNDRIDIYKLDLNEENEMEKKRESKIVKEYLKKYYENRQHMKELIDSKKQFKKELLDKLSQELEVPREKIWVVGLTVGIDQYPISEELIANIQQISVSYCMTTNKKNIQFSLDEYDNDIEL